MSYSTQVITLSAKNLVRHYGSRQIIHDVSLQLHQGEVLGLLGHNGAGKSTTMQMLTGCLQPSKGEIEICGTNLLQHPKLAKRHLGYLPETPPLYREFTVWDYLSFVAKLREVPQSKLEQAKLQTLQCCGLESVRNKVIGNLSKGYQQRVGIAQAIINSPQVIILDEPTVGLDPAQIRETRALIRDLGNRFSVILSTHLLSEVENLCDRIEILHQGKIIYSNTKQSMQQEQQGRSLEDFFVEMTRTNKEDNT